MTLLLVVACSGPDHVRSPDGPTFAPEIPCATFTAGSGFPPNQCYSTIQGTSMAAPHVAADLALIKSVHPSWGPAQLPSPRTHL